MARKKTGNARRASEGMLTLEFFTETFGENLRGLERQNLVDLLAQLGHYCDTAKLDLQDCLHSAGTHYKAENPTGIQFTSEDSRVPKSPDENNSCCDGDTFHRANCYKARPEYLAAMQGGELDVCMAGNGAIDGICGDPDCVCAGTTVK
jgi:hypothetical protein